MERIETDLLNNFKRLGVVAAPLNGFERLHVMHDILRMDEQEPFRFSWDWLAPSGLSTKEELLTNIVWYMRNCLLTD